MQENILFANIEEMINTLPVFKIIGAIVCIEELGKASVSIGQIEDIHTGGFQSTAVNGMVIMGLLDSAICASALSYLDGNRCATIEISVKFMKPISGCCVKAIGSVASRSGNLFYCQSSIVDNLGRIKALATGVVKSI
jgi:uncharacterized protein (TIGR00369 family)